MANSWKSWQEWRQRHPVLAKGLDISGAILIGLATNAIWQAGVNALQNIP